MSIAEAKARLLAGEAPGRSSPAIPRSWTLPAVGGALLVGYFLARKRRGGKLGAWSIGALMLNPTLRSAAMGIAVTAARRIMQPPRQ
jgi:hypothetical protein